MKTIANLEFIILFHFERHAQLIPKDNNFVFFCSLIDPVKSIIHYFFHMKISQ